MPSPQRIRWAKIRTLLTVLVALSILSVLIYLLVGGNPFGRDVIIRSYITDSGGMVAGSPVRLNGIRVGEVEYLGLARPPRGGRAVEIRLSVSARAAASIPDDSIVEIAAENLLGDKLIEITAGRSPVPVPPGGELRYQPPQEIDRTQVIASFEKNLRLVDRLLTDIETGRGSLGRFIREESLYEATRVRLGQVERGLRNFRSQGSLAPWMENDDRYRSLQAAAARYDRMLADIEAGRGAAGEWLRDPGRHDNLLRRVADLRRQIAAMRTNRYLASEEDYRKWLDLVRRLEVAVDDLNLGEGAVARLLRTSHTYESLSGAARQLQEGLRDFQQNPQKFLRINLDLF
jgi:phospholipid/cholesterol/gamma-HCH transport system substrate-binding protein